MILKIDRNPDFHSALLILELSSSKNDDITGKDSIYPSKCEVICTEIMVPNILILNHQANNYYHWEA